MKTKTILLTILSVFFINGLFAQSVGDTFIENNINYKITSAAAPRTVEVIANNYTGSVDILETVTHQGTTYSVTSIASLAFANLSALTSVTIGNSVTSIGNYAFQSCSALTLVTIGNSVTSIGTSAFYGCTKLTSVTIGESVTSIGTNAFQGCSKLALVIIPDKVTSIGQAAFSNCSALASVTIGNSVTSIDHYAFESCSALTSVTIPDKVTSIGTSAFFGCSKLTSVTISDKVTSIGTTAFQDCKSLTSVTIGESVTSIGWATFANCSALASVTIGNSVTSIGNNAFESCSALTSVTIPDKVKSIGTSAFYGCTKLRSVTIGKAVESIGEQAFQSCSALESVTIPNSVTSIGQLAFHGCSKLTSVIIPDKVTSIGDQTFQHCSALKSVTIGKAVTSIGNFAFHSCSALKTIVSYIKDPAEVSFGTEYPFYLVDKKTLKIYVPHGTKKTYEGTTTTWRNLVNNDNQIIEFGNLTVTGISIKDREYNGTLKAEIIGTAEYIGTVVPIHEVNLVTSGAEASFEDKNVGKNRVVTVAGYTLSGKDAASYSLTMPTNLKASITAKALTIESITVKDKAYDGGKNVKISSVNMTGNITGDDLTVVGSFADKEVGKDKAVTLSMNGNDKNNYTFTLPTDLKASIIAKPLTVEGVTVVAKEYDGNKNATLQGGTLKGIVEIETVNFTAGTGTFENKDVGTGKTVTAEGYTLSGDDAGNYSLVQPTGLTGDITAKDITVTADAKAKTLGSNDPELTYTFNPQLIEDDSFSGKLAREAGETVGTYKILIGDLSAGTNYNLIFVGADFSITDKPIITVTAEAKAKTYGDNDPELTYTFNPQLAEGDSFTGKLTREAGEAVGTYKISQGDLLAGGNYTLVFNGANLSITAKPITVTAEAKTKVYGNNDPELTYTFNPQLIEGDSFEGKLAREEGEAIGTYKILQGNLSAGDNYALSFVEGIFTIKAVAVESITLNLNDTSVERGKTFTLIATILPENATDKTVTFSSDKPEIASVDNNGKVSAIAIGKAVITAQAGDKTATCTLTVTIPDGVKDTEKVQAFFVYPSIVNDRFTVESKQAGSKMSIYNLTGKKVYEQVLHSQKEEINISQLQSGVYMIRIDYEIIKIVKE